MVNAIYSQTDELRVEVSDGFKDSTSSGRLLTNEEVEVFVFAHPTSQGESIIGGYVSSIFYESIDSAEISIRIDGRETGIVFSREGLFCYVGTLHGRILDLTISHPDFHPFDTTFLLHDVDTSVIKIVLEPKYKILLRGRVYAGNMPLEGTDVEIKHAEETIKIRTLGCYYDNENYWNCLYDGMFKADLTTEDPDDSVEILLTKDGMRPLKSGLIFNEYTGEVIRYKMKYLPNLPVVPLNNLNLKLGFPITSNESDWFVSLSYYRLLNRKMLRRIAIGVDGNMYISNISVENNTFPGIATSETDSSYINGFVGPSFLIWILPPERRYFSTYTGITLAKELNNNQFSFQPFIGTRFFLDLNKAISFEFRYTEFDLDIVHYTFNPYGNADRYSIKESLTKFHLNIGIQVTF